MKKITLLVIAMLVLFGMCYACFRHGINYAIENAVHYTVDCNAQETTYDLYIELPDGNVYVTELFIC